MSNYIRLRTPGGTFFFTVVTFQRRRIFAHPGRIDTFLHILAGVQNELPFVLDAWVILPDHLHCVWTLPAGEVDYSKRWGLIKARFTKAVGRDAGNTALLTGSRVRHREGTIWQRRFWEHRIRDDRDLEAHLNYLHYNPVKHGLAAAPKDWPYSSFGDFVEQGLYPPDWAAGGELAFGDDFGE